MEVLNMNQESKKAGVSLVEFYELLDRHDWTYQYSDDVSVWRRGDGSFTEW